MNPSIETIKDPLLRHLAALSERLNFKQVDACPEGILNRILWHAAKGSGIPFPKWATTTAGKDDD
jgi:hypothetical protein